MIKIRGMRSVEHAERMSEIRDSVVGKPEENNVGGL
jgi:hypothetical protein